MINYYFRSLTDIFEFGMHKGLSLCDVLALDMDYIYWCQNNIPEFYISVIAEKQIMDLFPDFIILKRLHNL